MKKIFLLVSVILLVSFIVAAVDLINRDIDLSKENKDTLAEHGITNLNLSDILCDDVKCYVVANDEGLRDREYYVPRYYRSCAGTFINEWNETVLDCTEHEYSLSEIQIMIDEAIKKDLENIASTIRARDYNSETNKGSGGTVEIK